MANGPYPASLDPRSPGYQDPTALTDKAIQKAAEVYDAKVNALGGLVEAKLSAIKEAATTQVLYADRHTDIAVRDLQILIQARIESVEQMIAARAHEAELGRQEISKNAWTIFETRLNAIDKAQAAYERQVADQTAQMRELYQEKFTSIGVQFSERDARVQQAAYATKDQVETALNSAKEAATEQNRSFATSTSKSEAATTKQIDTLATGVQTVTKGLEDKISDLKDRLTRIEGMDLGSTKLRTETFTSQAVQHGANSNILGILSAVVASLSLMAAVGGWMYTASRTSPVAPLPVYQTPSPVPVPQRGLFISPKPI
jgi:hypothetical protein